MTIRTASPVRDLPNASPSTTVPSFAASLQQQSKVLNECTTSSIGVNEAGRNKSGEQIGYNRRRGSKTLRWTQQRGVRKSLNEAERVLRKMCVRWMDTKRAATGDRKTCRRRRWRGAVAGFVTSPRTATRAETSHCSECLLWCTTFAPPSSARPAAT